MRKVFIGLSLLFWGGAGMAFPGSSGPMSLAIGESETRGPVVINTDFASGSTGGGYAVSCVQTPLAEESFQLLDTYEVEKKFGFELVKAAGDLEEDYFRSVDRTYTLQGHPHLAEEIRDSIMQNLTNVFNHVRFVETSEELPYVYDVGQTATIPPRCELVQVALFVDDPQEIIILRPLWNKLSTLDQAALLQHEVFGHWYRQIGESTTESARTIVAHMFAKNPGPAMWDGLPNDAPMNFTTHDGHGVYQSSSVFYVYEMNYPSGSFTRVQFSHLFGRAALVKTYIDLPLVDWNLKASYKKVGDEYERICNYNIHGVNLSGTTPVQGTMANGTWVEYHIKSGEPVKFSLIKNGQTLSRNTVSTCN